MKQKYPFTRYAALAVVATGIAVGGISDSYAYRMIQNASTGRVTAGAAVTCSDPGGFTHWTNNATINWHHNMGGQGAGMAPALQAALGSWANVPSANHVPTYAGATGAGWATDGQNTVLWAAGNGCSGSCLALTALVLNAGQEIVESDVTFNEEFAWNSNGNDYDTEAVAAHEFGHSLGIHHTELGDAPLPTMYATYFGTDGRSLEGDDHGALQCAESRYPLPGGGGPITDTPTMTEGEGFVSGGWLYAKGYYWTTFGSLNPATTANGRTHAILADEYWQVTTYSFSMLSVMGFASDPGQAWLESVTARGVTKTGLGAGGYIYNNGTANWQWTDAPFGFTGSGSTGVTIVHAP